MMLGTAKLYESYNMTNLGANQVYNSGDFYRQRYLVDGVADQIAGISPEIVNSSQLYASAPDQDVRSRNTSFEFGPRNAYHTHRYSCRLPVSFFKACIRPSVTHWILRAW